jgi:hypothetical protein
MIMKRATKLAGSIAIVFGAMSASAATFDGSQTLLCALQDVTECETGTECLGVTPEGINVPDFLQVDAANKVISATPEAGTGRTTAIERTEHMDGKLVLQGADDGVEGVRDGLAWSMVIDDTSGKLVLSASGDGVAFVAFGACTLR